MLYVILVLMFASFTKKDIINVLIIIKKIEKEVFHVVKKVEFKQTKDQTEKYPAVVEDGILKIKIPQPKFFPRLREVRKKEVSR